MNDKYTLGEELGRGQYGIVYRCTDRVTGRQFACKAVAGSNKKAVEEAISEVRVLSSLKSCSNIVTLEDVYQDQDTKDLYMIMELAPGGDMLSRLERKGRLSEFEARKLFWDVVRGVKQCHENGVIHRDIKPDNILLYPYRRITNILGSPYSNVSSSAPFAAKLTDFGISMPLQPREVIRGYAGSFPYEAPEVMAGEVYDFSADVWSLGVTLYAMLSGRWPNFENGLRRFDEKKDWDFTCWLVVSSRAKNLIRRMLVKDFADRPSLDQILSDPWFVGFPQTTKVNPTPSVTSDEQKTVPVTTTAPATWRRFPPSSPIHIKARQLASSSCRGLAAKVMSRHWRCPAQVSSCSPEK